MNLTPILAQGPLGLSGGALIAGVCVVIGFVVIIVLALVLSRYTKVGPNQVLVVSGRKHKVTEPDGTVSLRGFRVVKGGGSFIIPMIERWTFFRWSC